MEQSMQPQAAQFFDMCRSGVRTATDIMKISLENAERLQHQQYEAVRNALEENAKTVSQLAEAKNLEELLSMQTRLAQGQLERMMNYWGTMLRTTGSSATNTMENVAAGMRDVSRDAAAQAERKQPPDRKSA